MVYRWRLFTQQHVVVDYIYAPLEQDICREFQHFWKKNNQNLYLSTLYIVEK